MNRYAWLLVAAITLGGCYTTSNPNATAPASELEAPSADDTRAEAEAKIPAGSQAIVLYSADAPSELYRDVYRSLARAGFGIEQENQEMGTISTNYKEIRGGTTLRMSVFVDTDDAGSTATFRGEWGLNSTTAAGLSGALGVNVGGTTESAKWEGRGRPRMAFSDMNMFALGIEHTSISYTK